MKTRVGRAYGKVSYEKRQWVRTIFSPVKAVISSIDELFFTVYSIPGEDAYFVTPFEPDISFVRYFYPEASLKKMRTIFAWSLKKFARSHDRVIVAMPRNDLRFFDDGLITVPFFRQVITVDKPPETLKQFRKHKKTIRSYDFEISKDPDALKFFYDKMYLPFTKERHKDALIEDLSKLQYLLKNTGELLLIRREQEVVGGMFCRETGDTYYGLSVGLIDDRWLTDDAVPALFYHALGRARELGARQMDFGESRPFLSDGVLEYKRRWGCHVVRNGHDKYYYYLKNIAKDGLIFLDGETITALVSEKSAETYRQHPDPGLGVRIMEPAGPAMPASGSLPLMRASRPLALVSGMVHRISSLQKTIARK